MNQTHLMNPQNRPFIEGKSNKISVRPDDSNVFKISELELMLFILLLCPIGFFSGPLLLSETNQLKVAGVFVIIVFIFLYFLIITVRRHMNYSRLVRVLESNGQTTYAKVEKYNVFKDKTGTFWGITVKYEFTAPDNQRTTLHGRYVIPLYARQLDREKRILDDDPQLVVRYVNPKLYRLL